MSVEAHDPVSFRKPNPLYSSLTTAKLSSTSTLVTIAGQVAEDPETNEVPHGLSAQLDVCLRRLSACLDHAGARKRDVTRLMYYITQRGLDEIDREEGEGAGLRLIATKVGTWLEGWRPASCYLRVFGMSDDRFLCEFECMAVVTKD